MKKEGDVAYSKVKVDESLTKEEGVPTVFFYVEMIAKASALMRGFCARTVRVFLVW